MLVEEKKKNDDGQNYKIRWKDVSDFIYLSIFVCIFWSMSIYSLVVNPNSSTRFYTTWALFIHTVNVTTVLVLCVISVSSARAVCTLTDAYIFTILPTIIIIAVTVFISIMILLLIYPKKLLDSDSFTASDLAEAEIFNFMTHVLPVFLALWLRSAFYARVKYVYDAQDYRDANLLAALCTQRVYIAFLRMYVTLLVYATFFDAEDVYNTPQEESFFVVFGSAIVASLYVGFGTVASQAYRDSAR